MGILSYLNPIKAVVDAVAKPVQGVLNKREETKQIKQTAEAKLANAKLNSETQVTLSDAEWEAISKSNENETWKDEYLTIVITSPILLMIIGGVYMAFTGDDRILSGTVEGLKHIKEAGVDMGFLMGAVVTAGVGLKAWRGFTR